MQYDFLIVGTGFSGTVLANMLSPKYTILIIDKRNHIAGNMYDYTDSRGNIIHKYGPHILTTNNETIYEYLSKFGEWISVKVKLQSYIDRKYISLPINLNSIREMFSDGEKIANLLIDIFGYEQQVNIIDLLNSEEKIIADAAKTIYDKVFVGYNAKMWGLSPLDIDRSVLGRSPIRISYEDRKFNTKYEVVPKNGYSELFKKMLDSPNIDVKLSICANDLIEVKNNHIVSKTKDRYKTIIYTGNIDELLNYKFGHLPYRAIKFRMERRAGSLFSSASATYPQNYKKTRTTEMRKITGQILRDDVVLVSEYPGQYDKNSRDFANPSYPVLNKESKEMHKQYIEEISHIDNIYAIGRLAEFKYINMEETIINAMNAYKIMEEADYGHF